MTPSSHVQVPGPSPGGPMDESAWLAQCWREGVTASFGACIQEVGPRILSSALAREDRLALCAFGAMAAMGRGDYRLADELLAGHGTAATKAVHLLDSAVRLYRACAGVDLGTTPLVVFIEEMHLLHQELRSDLSVETTTARGYAGLVLAEAFLVIGDFGAARAQLELIIDEGNAPRVVLTAARCLVGGLENSLGRPDLAIRHLQAATRAASGLDAEERLAWLLLIGMVLPEDRRYGMALFQEFLTRYHDHLPAGHGTLSQIYRMIQLLIPQGAEGGTVPLLVRAEVRDLLRQVQSRHYSAGWFVLFTSMCAGLLRSAHDPCEAYSVLVQAAATLHVRRMDGAAGLCDSQIDALRSHIGEEQFEALLAEARRRRRLLASGTTPAQ